MKRLKLVNVNSENVHLIPTVETEDLSFIKFNSWLIIPNAKNFYVVMCDKNGDVLGKVYCKTFVTYRFVSGLRMDFVNGYTRYWCYDMIDVKSRQLGNTFEIMTCKRSVKKLLLEL